MKRPVRLAGACIAGMVLAAAPSPAAAQKIVIPDFRNEAPPAGSCPDCGTVRSVREVSSRRARDVPPGIAQQTMTSGGPVDDSNIVGGVFVHRFGSSEEPGDTYVGGVGTPEMQKRWTDTSYEITVRMDDGSYRLLERRDGGRFAPGDRVRMKQGAIEKI